MRKKLPQTIIVALVVAALLVGAVSTVWLAIVAVAVAALYVWDLRRSLAHYENRGLGIAQLMTDAFRASGTPRDQQRLVTVLDRLSATFGVNSVNAVIVEDPGYNAALVPSPQGYSLFVTDALMRDFELIELEGVVAHCLARQRLGLLARESVSCLGTMSDASRRILAGPGTTYRADEVAAATIRYPLGIAGALHKCSGQMIPPSSFLSTPRYAQWRWIWFDVRSDRREIDITDLDDAELRALALQEW